MDLLTINEPVGCLPDFIANDYDGETNSKDLIYLVDKANTKTNPQIKPVWPNKILKHLYVESANNFGYKSEKIDAKELILFIEKNLPIKDQYEKQCSAEEKQKVFSEFIKKQKFVFEIKSEKIGFSAYDADKEAFIPSFGYLSTNDLTLISSWSKMTFNGRTTAMDSVVHEVLGRPVINGTPKYSLESYEISLDDRIKYLVNKKELTLPLQMPVYEAKDVRPKDISVLAVGYFEEKIKNQSTTIYPSIGLNQLTYAKTKTAVFNVTELIIFNNKKKSAITKIPIGDANKKNDGNENSVRFI